MEERVRALRQYAHNPLYDIKRDNCHCQPHFTSAGKHLVTRGYCGK